MYPVFRCCWTLSILRGRGMMGRLIILPSYEYGSVTAIGNLRAGERREAEDEAVVAMSAIKKCNWN